MYKVLLVDDEILIREAISENVPWEKHGFELAHVCDNGKTAIEYLKENTVDLVITDICMPYVDGMGLSKYIYENHPETMIIIFSGYSDFEYAKQAIQYKVAEYVLKPVTARELTEVLDKIKEKLDVEQSKEKKINKLTEIYHNYTKNEAIIISRVLSDLVRGSQHVEKSIEELKEFDICIQEGKYRVAAIDIDIFCDMYNADNELKKESALMSFVVENISGEIMGEYKAGISYNDTDNRVCLLFCEDDNDTSISICEEIKESVYDAMKLSISIGIGKRVSSLEDLYKSYKSATEVLRFRYTKGCGQIFDAENDFSLQNQKELEDYFHAVIAALRTSNKDMLEEALRNIESWFSKRYLSRNMAVAYLHQVMRMIKEAVLETCDTFELTDNDITSVTTAVNLSKAMGFIREYANKGFDATVNVAQTSGERQAVLALDYLEKNYSDPNLNLNQICEFLNISTSRFSSIFKEATGKTFVEALTNIRMERAKTLLRQTSLKNYEIAEKVGFSDPHYFSISFKKMTGKTPKEYAKEKLQTK